MITKETRGISLIVLVITIIVVIILASVVILNVTKNNPIESAKKAKFLSDMDSIKTELELYVTKKQTDTLGGYERVLLEATKDKVSEEGKEDSTRNISDIISGIKGTKYEEKIEIINGEIVYVGKDKNEIEWSNEKNIEVTAIKINLSNDTDEVSIKGKVTVKGSIVDKNKIEKYKIYVAKNNEEYANEANRVIEEKKDEIEYVIEGLKTGTEYKIKVEVTMDGKKYEKEEKNIKTINDTEAPDVEKIEVVVTQEIWSSVKIRLENIPEDAVILEYTKPNTIEWIKYTKEFEVTENGEINIRVEDRAGNEAVRTVIIDKIDDRAANVSAKINQSKMKLGTNNNIEEYFKIEKNGDAPISSIIYREKNDGTSIEDTSNFSAGSHIIECEVRKENGKISVATTKISIIDYGTSISSFYDNLYLGVTDGVTSSTNFECVGNFNGFYLIPSDVQRVELHHKDIHNGVGSSEYTEFSQNYINAGQNYYPLEIESNLNRWLWINVVGSWSTETSHNIGNLSLKYKDGTEYTLEDSVKNGYIEPLVLAISGSTEGFLFRDVTNLITGGMTDDANYGHIQVYFKIKDKSPLVGINLYSSIDFIRTYADGLSVLEAQENFEISISPW